MKTQSLSIIVVFMLLVPLAAVRGGLQENETNSPTVSHTEIKDVRVAIYTDTPNEEYFLLPLQNYQWTVGQTRYRFVPTLLTTKDILKNQLTTTNYDVLIYSFNQADQYLFRTGLSRLPQNKILVRDIDSFVENGGGYYGSCGAAAIAGGMINTPTSFLERAMKQSSLGISGVQFEYHTAIPILTELRGRSPETVDTQAYLLYSGWNVPNPHEMNYSGICPEVRVNKSTAIFDDFIGTTRKIRWIGMSAFEIPEHPDREIIPLGYFPSQEISENVSSQIHYWTYTGGLVGLLNGLLFGNGTILWLKNFGVLNRAFFFSTDWEKTDTIVQTHVADKPFMTAEVYPTEQGARIIRCSGHPELVTWWGGHLEDITDNQTNNLYVGLYRLVGATPMNQTIEDEKTYNYCIIRRCIAWAAKVPDNDLPPVYGPSQVSDLAPFHQQDSFTLVGNTEDVLYRNLSLEFHYRYSEDNVSTWTNWTLLGADAYGADGWSSEFHAPEGSGYYQFYSLRRVDYDGYTELETVPPGPDAIAYVEAG